MGTNILQILENFLKALVAYQPTYSYRQIDTINSEKIFSKTTATKSTGSINRSFQFPQTSLEECYTTRHLKNQL